MNHGASHGLVCCERLVQWRDLSFQVHRDGADGLVWVWCCPDCGKHLRTDPFDPPVLDYDT